MPDQTPVPTPASGTAPNSNRITAMLQDLAAQRSAPPQNLPTPVKPVSPAPMPPTVTPPPRPATPPPAPIPPKPTPPPAPAPQQSGYTSELRTMSADINNLKTGQAPVGIKPPTPGAPVAPAAPSAPAPSISIPPASSGGMVKKLAFGLLALGAIGIVAYIIMAMVGGGTQEATPTPSPSASVSASPTAKLLRAYFGTPGSSINLQSSTTGTDDFLSGLATIQPAAKQAAVVTLQHAGSSASPLTFLNDTVGTVPASLSMTFGSDWLALIYGQTEHFSATGALTTDTTVANRPALVIELTNASTANQAMQAWENTGLATAFAKLFQYNTSKKLIAGFSSGTYRQIPVRYQNFPYADQSLDYAIVTASNNKNYLTIASSREALFFAIDQLMQ